MKGMRVISFEASDPQSSTRLAILSGQAFCEPPWKLSSVLTMVKLPLALESCHTETSSLRAQLGSGTELQALCEPPWYLLVQENLLCLLSPQKVILLRPPFPWAQYSCQALSQACLTAIGCSQGTSHLSYLHWDKHSELLVLEPGRCIILTILSADMRLLPIYWYRRTCCRYDYIFFFYRIYKCR